jgi:hypothetical protein
MTQEPSPMAITRAKQVYETPRLVCYGALRDLTQNGTGATIENATGNPQNPCTADPNKHSCV